MCALLSCNCSNAGYSTNKGRIIRVKYFIVKILFLFFFLHFVILIEKSMCLEVGNNIFWYYLCIPILTLIHNILYIDTAVTYVLLQDQFCTGHGGIHGYNKDKHNTRD